MAPAVEAMSISGRSMWFTSALCVLTKMLSGMTSVSIFCTLGRMTEISSGVISLTGLRRNFWYRIPVESPSVKSDILLRS